MLTRGSNDGESSLGYCRTSPFLATIDVCRWCLSECPVILWSAVVLQELLFKKPSTRRFLLGTFYKKLSRVFLGCFYKCTRAFVNVWKMRRNFIILTTFTTRTTWMVHCVNFVLWMHPNHFIVWNSNPRRGDLSFRWSFRLSFRLIYRMPDIQLVWTKPNDHQRWPIGI